MAITTRILANREQLRQMGVESNSQTGENIHTSTSEKPKLVSASPNGVPDNANSGYEFSDGSSEDTARLAAYNQTRLTWARAISNAATEYTIARRLTEREDQLLQSFAAYVAATLAKERIRPTREG